MPHPPIWAVILAAGAGTRLASLTGGIPKQYWKRGNAPTLLADTLSRLSDVAMPDRTLVVAADEHRRYLKDERDIAARARVLYQPEDRGTAAGVLLALRTVLAEDRDPMVVFTPADHGVGDLAAFRAGLNSALSHAARSDQIVLCAVEADRAVEDYGWVVPVEDDRRTLRRVRAFVEKPARPLAEQLLRQGAVWNTMVVIARAVVLLRLFEEHLPVITATIGELGRYQGDARRAFLAAAYRSLPSRDFSRDLLQRAGNLAAYVWPTGVEWSDLGTPERLAQWLGRSNNGKNAAA